MKFLVIVTSSDTTKTYSMPSRETQLARLTALLITCPSAVVVSDKRPDKFARAADPANPDAVIEVLA